MSAPDHLKKFQFQKGTTGNAAGRTKGLAKLVRDTVGDDMPAIIRAQVAIAKGKKPDGFEGAQLKPSDVTKAAEWIRDTGWHKPLQRVEQHNIDGAVEDELETMTDDALDEVIAEGDAAMADLEAGMDTDEPTESDDRAGEPG
jgi:hypothetical protein